MGGSGGIGPAVVGLSVGDLAAACSLGVRTALVSGRREHAASRAIAAVALLARASAGGMDPESKARALLAAVRCVAAVGEPPEGDGAVAREQGGGAKSGASHGGAPRTVTGAVREAEAGGPRGKLRRIADQAGRVAGRESLGHALEAAGMVGGRSGVTSDSESAREDGHGHGSGTAGPVSIAGIAADAATAADWAQRLD